MTSAATKFLVILTALFLGILPLTHAQDNRPDIIHVTLPPQVHSVTLQTAEYIVLGKKDRAKYGKSFLGYTGMQVHCYIGQKLKPKELRRILKKIRNCPYENIVFDGFVTDQVSMDHSFHAGVLPGLLVGEYPSFTLRRSSK